MDAAMADIRPAMSRCFAADLAALDEALDFLREAGAAAALSAEALKRAELVIEELFTNTATHGTRLARASAPDDTKLSLSVWLGVEVLPDGLQLRYEDDAPAFDPTAVADGAAEAALADAQAGLSEGGLGRVLIRELPSSVQYSRAAGRNCLLLTFAR